MSTTIDGLTPTPSSAGPASAAGFGSRWLGRLLVAISAVSLGFYGLGFFAPYSFYAELTTHFHFQNFWLMFWLTVLLAWTPYRIWHNVMILFTVIAASTALPTYWPLSTTEATGAKLRLMSFNVLGSNHDVTAVVAEIRRQQPDVLVLQEYTARWHEDLNSQLSEYTHRALHPRWHGFGIAIYSKLPLSQSQLVPLTRQLADIPALVAQVAVAGQSLTVVGVHTASPVSPNRMRLRNQQMFEIAELANRISGLKVIVGDYNCTPWSPYFRQLIQQTNLRDSREGFGHQGSWSAFPMVPIRIPIDHALLSPQIAVISRWNGQHSGSDHRPIVMDLQLPAGQQP